MVQGFRYGIYGQEIAWFGIYGLGIQGLGTGAQSPRRSCPGGTSRRNLLHPDGGVWSLEIGVQS